MEFTHLLKNNNLKITPQRMAILEQIHKKGHASIDEIYESIHITHPSMSLATIYKNITAMQEASILSEVKLPNSRQRYELAKKPHIHLVCEVCGEVMDAQIECLEYLKNACKNHSGFIARDSSVAVMGVCSKCANK